MKILSSHNNYSESPSAEDADDTKEVFFFVLMPVERLIYTYTVQTMPATGDSHVWSNKASIIFHYFIVAVLDSVS